MEKKGQVTAFIIIGLVLLILIGSIVAIKQGYLDATLEKLGFVKTAPIQIESIQNFMSSCVSEIGKDGIENIALHGGYNRLETDGIPTTPFTPLQSNLEIIPGSDLKTAVWFRESGNGIQEFNIPSKQNIENELNFYVNERFIFCLQNLTSFSEQGFIMEASGTPETETTISNNRVNVDISYPIKITKDNTEFNLEKHSASIDSNLEELYETAIELINKENTDTFLENKTLAALIAYDPEVPFSGMDTSCTEKTWYKPIVVEKLKNIIFENTAAIRVKGTNAKTKKDLEYLQFDALKDNKNLDISFMYIPNWPTVIEITPSEGNILRSNSIGKRTGSGAQALVSSFICLSDNRFVYDIKYPVLVTIRDNSGLIFQFATEVIIDNNAPRINRQTILDIPEVNEEICKYPRKNAEITTSTVDEHGDLMPLDNVALSFKCLPANCDLGSSKLEGREPILKTMVPLCFNGIIEGRKEGYLSGKTIFSSNDADEEKILVTLEPKYKKKVNIFVIDKESGEMRKPYDTEQISFQFGSKEQNFIANYNYPGEDEIELAAGDYNVNSYLIRNSTWGITTKKETIETCIDTKSAGLLAFFKNERHCEKTEIESMELEYALTGGGNFEVSFGREELSSNEPLNLYILSDTIPSDLDGMQRIQISLETNKDNPLFKYPGVGA